MASIFDVLPGIDVPVGAIKASLSRMWADTAAKGGAAPAASDVRAMQVNFVLHLGFQTTPADAAQQFQTAVKLSRRYPCRVVVLCPLPPDDPASEMRAKVYGECQLGRNRGDTRCCEFVMLSYPMSARQHLENQVSVCLSTDLPLYYWAHRFSSSARLNDYRYLLTRSRRVIIDSAVAPADALGHPWPRPEAVRDLAFARLLPVRQSLGGFLAGFTPGEIAGGLEAGALEHGPDLAPEARVLLEWIRGRLAACGAPGDAALTVQPGGGEGALHLALRYRGGLKRFGWRADVRHGTALFDADLGRGPSRLPASVSLLSPEAALTEAMFF
jgi:hypothetical protein